MSENFTLEVYRAGEWRPHEVPEGTLAPAFLNGEQTTGAPAVAEPWRYVDASGEVRHSSPGAPV